MPDAPEWPRIYFGGSSPAALEVAARQADVYLTWGEPPAQVAEKLDRVRDAGRAARAASCGYGIRLHAIARETLRGGVGGGRQAAGPARPGSRSSRRRRTCAQSSSEGQRRMLALNEGSKDGLEIYPNLWAGVGLVRGGAGTALVGSYEEVADRIAEYHEHGLDEFILSGYPHLEEAYHVGEGVLPILRERGLLKERAGLAAV